MSSDLLDLFEGTLLPAFQPYVTVREPTCTSLNNYRLTLRKEFHAIFVEIQYDFFELCLVLHLLNNKVIIKSEKLLLEGLQLKCKILN